MKSAGNTGGRKTVNDQWWEDVLPGMHPRDWATILELTGILWEPELELRSLVEPNRCSLAKLGPTPARSHRNALAWYPRRMKQRAEVFMPSSAAPHCLLKAPYENCLHGDQVALGARMK